MMSDSDPEPVDVEQYTGDTVRLMTHIVGVMSTPHVLTGEVSGSGKTIRVVDERFDRTYRVDTAEIMSGESEYRDSSCVQLYTPERFQRVQHSNHAPGPQSGCNEVSDTEDLPEPTHRPEGEDWVEDGPEDDDDGAEPTSEDADPQGEDGQTVMTDGGKPVSDYEDVSSANAWVNYDEVELLHLLELVRKGDELNVNERRRPLTVTDVYDSVDARTITLSGNGTRYTLTVERDPDGEPTHAVIQFPSGYEYVNHARVANRNALHVSEYDQLLSEELETVAAGEYVDHMMGFVERSPDRTWSDLSERDRTGEWSVDGDELTAVKWAIHAFVSYYRDGGKMGGSDTTLDRYQDALALWERVRGEREQAWFVGREFGLIGAYLDYSVEDLDIRARIPEPVVDAVDALRRGEDVPNIGSDSRVSHPEDATCPTCGGDGEVYDDRSIIACPDCDGEDAATDGGSDIREVLQAVSEGERLTVRVDASADGPSKLTGRVSDVDAHHDGANSAVVLTADSGEYVVPVTDSPAVASLDGYRNIGRCVSVERDTARTDGGVDADAARLETVHELADHLGGLPEPSEDPTEKYAHPGKRYKVLNGGSLSFVLTAYYPDAIPDADGVVEFRMANGERAYSEHERDDSGVAADLIAPYVPEDANLGVLTVNALMSDVRDLTVGEVDGFSYADAYWHWMDSREDTSEVMTDGGGFPDAVEFRVEPFFYDGAPLDPDEDPDEPYTFEVQYLPEGSKTYKPTGEAYDEEPDAERRVEELRAEWLSDSEGEPATDGGEWNPEPAELRTGGTTDISAHARRNAEQLRMAREELDDEDAHQDGERTGEQGSHPGGEGDD